MSVSLKPSYKLGLCVAVVTGLLLLAQLFPLILSDMLIKDDQLYLTSAYQPLASDGLNLLLLGLAKIFSAPHIRLLLIAITALAVAMWGTYLALRYNRPALMVVPAVALIFPESVSQFLFVNGSHPTWALPASLGVFVTCDTLSRGTARSGTWLIFGILCSLLTVEISPVAPLLPLAGLVFLWRFRRSLSWGPMIRLAVVAAAGPIWFIWKSLFLPQLQNQYIQRSGWISFDPAYWLTRLFDLSATAFGELAFLFAAGLVLGLAGLMILSRLIGFRSASKAERDASNLWLWVLVCLAAAGLTLLPVLAVRELAPRYLELPTFFSVCAILILAVAIAGKPSGKIMVPGSLLFALLIIPSARSQAIDEYGTLDAQSQFLKTALAAEADAWPDQAQVVILGDGLAFSGLHNWSTGALRNLSGREDVLGLISDRRLLQGFNPLVEEWANHGPDYWFIDAQGNSIPKRFVGLEQDRPVFGYVYDPDASELTRSSVYFVDADGVFQRAPFGGFFQRHDTQSPFQAACTYPQERVIDLGSRSVEMVFEDADAVSQSAVPPFNLQLGGATNTRILIFRLSEAPELSYKGGFNETYPPTPVFSPPLTIWQRATELWQATINDVRYEHTGSDLTTQITLEVGCGYEVIFSGRRVWVFDDSLQSLDLKIGQGYHDRLWDGTIHLKQE